ncbi:hypothetical protein [Sphingobacterium sp.]|uniref:hypothetical protein n=1 Tax=Sphingobacterium sp. TaxID=341027 RepID=UPI00289F2ED7|nr:hypothetical protein [Sphingobacterium sp.]
MRLFFLFTAILLFNVSCKKNDEYFRSDTALKVFISNDKNEDLLRYNPDNSNTIDPSKLKIISSGNNNKNPSPAAGKLTPDIISPNYFIIKEEKDKKYLQLNFDPVYSESALEIVYNNNLSPDTLTADLMNKNGKIIYNIIYLNGVKVWDINTDKEHSIKIQRTDIPHRPL